MDADWTTPTLALKKSVSLCSLVIKFISINIRSDKENLFPTGVLNSRNFFLIRKILVKISYQMTEQYQNLSKRKRVDVDWINRGGLLRINLPKIP